MTLVVTRGHVALRIMPIFGVQKGVFKITVFNKGRIIYEYIQQASTETRMGDMLDAALDKLDEQSRKFFFTLDKNYRTIVTTGTNVNWASGVQWYHDGRPRQ